MLRLCLSSLVMLLLLTLILGVGYPVVTTLLAQWVFPQAASGSLVVVRGHHVGAEMVGQEFTQAGYFWGRPSATEPAYNAADSSGSNLAPTNPKLKALIAARRDALMRNTRSDAPPPADLLFASASGLDPHISVEAALWQIPRVAAARKMLTTKIEALVHETAEGRQLGVLGEPRVNVLKLNLALDRAAHGHQ